MIITIQLNLLILLFLLFIINETTSKTSILSKNEIRNDLLNNYIKTIELYKQGDYDNALEKLLNLKELYPDIIDIYSSLGLIYESKKDYKLAKESYLEGIKKGNKRISSFTTTTTSKEGGDSSLEGMLCNLLMNEKYKRKLSHPMHSSREDIMRHIEGITRWGLKSPIENIDEIINSFIDRHPDNELLEKTCISRTNLYPEDYKGFITLGKLYIINDDHLNALNYFEKAKKLLIKNKETFELDINNNNDNNNKERIELEYKNDLEQITNILQDLYISQYRRNSYREEDAEKAISYLKSAIENKRLASTISSLATILHYIKPLDPEPWNFIKEASLLRVEEVNKLLKERNENIREYAENWEDIGHVTLLDIEIEEEEKVNFPKTGETYQINGINQEFLQLSYGDRIPTKFKEQEFILIQMKDVSMESSTGILFTNSKVFFGAHSSIITDYHGGTEVNNQQVITIEETVATLDVANSLNWYHWLIEKIPQLLFTLKYLPDIPIMFINSSFSREIIELLNIPKEKVLWYNIEANSRFDSGLKRYHFKNMLRLDWRHSNDLIENGKMIDSWRHFSTKKGILLTRKEILNRITLKSLIHPKVIYVSRADAGYIRVVQNEHLLLNALKKRLGNCFHVFTSDINKAKNKGNSNTPMSLMDQAALFSSAEIVIGPHGAGLANILFAQENAALVYFPIKPMVDNCFAHLVAALNNKLYPVSDLTAYYFGPYHLTEKKVNSVMEVLEQVLHDKQWNDNQMCSSHSENNVHDEL